MSENKIPEWKYEAYRKGEYLFPPPDVPHARWTKDDWIRYIDACGIWGKIKR